MYCSISDAWNQENTMANLARRFNKEYFDNVPHQMEYFKVESDDVKGNDNSDRNYGNVSSVQKMDTTPKINNVPENLNTNSVEQKKEEVKIYKPNFEVFWDIQ